VSSVRKIRIDNSLGSRLRGSSDAWSFSSLALRRVGDVERLPAREPGRDCAGVRTAMRSSSESEAGEAVCLGEPGGRWCACSEERSRAWASRVVI
jgi:hypothetical protein